jgi:hypothetical protein
MEAEGYSENVLPNYQAVWRDVFENYNNNNNNFSMGQQPLAGQGLLIIEASRSHSDTPHSENSSGRVISPTQKPLPANTQQSQETDIYDPDGIRTHNPSKRTVADSRLRPRDHCDR